MDKKNKFLLQNCMVDLKPGLDVLLISFFNYTWDSTDLVAFLFARLLLLSRASR